MNSGLDNVVVTIDDTEHPEVYCEVLVGGQISLRVSERDGSRVAKALYEPPLNEPFEITGIAGERHVYRFVTILGVSTCTRAARHAGTLRDFQEEDEERALKRLAGRTFEE